MECARPCHTYSVVVVKWATAGQVKCRLHAGLGWLCDMTAACGRVTFRILTVLHTGSGWRRFGSIATVSVLCGSAMATCDNFPEWDYAIVDSQRHGDTLWHPAAPTNQRGVFLAANMQIPSPLPARNHVL